jgi:hypothetical protein
MNSTVCTAPLTFLLAKHIISCDNVFLKEYILLPTYRVFRPIYHHIKNIYKSIENWG